MSIFPTKILLAVDGSKEATLAASTAVELAKRTESELHIVYVQSKTEFSTPLAGRSLMPIYRFV